MKTIYLFTSRFPYGHGETFIEDELRVFPFAKFNLEVIPFRKEEKKRVIPGNVRLRSDLAQTSKFNLCKTVVKLLLSKKLWSLKKTSNPPRGFNEWKQAIKYLFGAILIQKYTEKLPLKEGDILYSYWFNHIPLGLTESLFRQGHRGVKVVTRAHRYDVYEREVGIYFPYRDLTCKHLDRIMCISDNGAEFLKKKFASYVDKIEVSRLGVFGPREVLYYKKHTATQNIHFVSCSGVTPVKRVWLIYELINQYAAMHGDFYIQWTHFGFGPLWDEVVAITKNKERNLSINFAGLKTKNEIICEYQKAQFDIFINLSESEGIPVSIMEAISHGIPVIATEVGGNPEIVLPGSGELVPKDLDYASFEAAVMRIYNHIDTYRKEAFYTYQKFFDAESNYTDFYSRL